MPASEDQASIAAEVDCAIVDLSRAVESLKDALSEQVTFQRTLPEAERARHSAAMRQLRESRDRVVRESIERRDARAGAAAARHERHCERMRVQRSEAIGKVEEIAETQLEDAQKKLDRALWLAEVTYESGEHAPKDQFERTRAALGSALADVRKALDTIDATAARCAHGSAIASARSTGRSPSSVDSAALAQWADTVRYATEMSQQALADVDRSRLLRLSKPAVLAVFVLCAAALGALAASLVGTSLGVDISAPGLPEGAVSRGLTGAVALALLSAPVALSIWWHARGILCDAAEAALDAKLRIEACMERATADAAALRRRQESARSAERDRAVARAKGRWQPAIEGIRRRRQELADAIAAKYEGVARQLDLQRDTELAAAEAECAASLESARAAHDAACAEEVARHTAELKRLHEEHQRVRTDLARAWGAARASWIETVRRCDEDMRRSSPSWSDPCWQESPLRSPAASRAGACVGTVTVDLAAACAAVPADKDLDWAPGTPREMSLPLCLSFPNRGSLLVESDLEGRAAGIAILNQAVLRLLTSLPPGKVQFLLVDPVGMGESFAGLMHLADESNAIIGNRIWSEARHVEQRLADLSEHLETVIQKYLRDEFASLDEYNRRAGEIAEPYRFIVMADFPTSLTDEAARRLSAIAAGGARCGVHTLILRDTRQPSASGCDLAMVRERSVCIARESGHWIASTPPLAGLRLEPSPLPSGPAAIDLVKRIGKRAAESARVEVPFSSIAPAGDALWTESSARRLSVPLGRAGATRLQRMVLGEGTQQHALIAGRTGSGKSTLLHAIVTNLALHYSPDEVEMWLIDFKKGVEFRTYATHRLPHARVVAIESDREFGISVLQGLDAELRRRGDLFRAAGVQDLAGYRAARKGDPMPRALLIIDEFQELFVEDDHVSQEASALLDRIVRQGRAFGMHAVLGSQTLGGAYTIARSTMGQMGVRIALQCNESDSQLILSDDNLAARLLARPGEAIYNDAGGLLEGNSPFQVVWLGDRERDERLDAVTRKAAPLARRQPLVVFEGTARASLDECIPLESARERARAGGDDSLAPRVWLGEAVAIAEPTHITLQRRSGANAVVVSQDEEQAIAMGIAAIESLSAQCPHARLVLIDSTTPDLPTYGMLERCASAAGLEVRVARSSDAADALAEVASTIAERESAQRVTDRAVVLMVHGAQRIRALRRNEDDYSFSSGDAPPSPDRVLAAIAREGPAHGVHAWIWVDNGASLARTVDRSTLREFDWRVLFQCSAADSSALIDSGAASRLGPSRALLHDELSGRNEKLRPWALTGLSAPRA